MTKKKRLIPIFIVALFVLILSSAIIIKQVGVQQQTALQETFNPIFCNDYSFTCCVEKEDFKQTVTITKAQFVRCPTTASRCEIISYNSPNILIGSENCKVRGISIFKQFACDDTRVLSSQPVVMKKGEYAYTDRTTALTYSVSKLELLDTGRAGSDFGVPVSGADGCTFTTDDTLYDESGSLIKEVSAGSISYTVATDSCVKSFARGDRHICGSVEEQCDTDNDCRVHTYGEFECTGRTLQKYGCTELSDFLPSGVSLIDGEFIYNNPRVTTSPNYGNVVKSRCEIVQATTVQCCGDTDCGSNAFCDNNPTSQTAWTCVSSGEVQCNQDSDCGVSQQCDLNTKDIKRPVCNDNRCEFDTITSGVECCSSADCASGSFCDTDNKCKEGTQSKTTSPFECSPAKGSQSDKDKYFPRPCAKDYFCNEENKCEPETEAECNWWEVNCQLKKSLTTFFKPAQIIFSIIFGVLMLAVSIGMFNKLGVEKPTNTILGVIVGIGFGFLFFFYIFFALITLFISFVIWLILPTKIKSLAKAGIKAGKKRL